MWRRHFTLLVLLIAVVLLGSLLGGWTWSDGRL